MLRQHFACQRKYCLDERQCLKYDRGSAAELDFCSDGAFAAVTAQLGGSLAYERGAETFQHDGIICALSGLHCDIPAREARQYTPMTVAAAAAVYGAKSLLSCFKSMTAQRAQIPPPHSRYIFIFRKCGV